MKNFNFRSWLLSLLLLAVILVTNKSYAQLTGTKNIPGDYANIAAAVADLNVQGVGAGGVTFNVNAGHTETAPITGIQVTATGTLANPIVIQKSGSGANPIINAGIGTGTPGSAVQDGVFALIGSDYVTIDAIDIVDGNTTNPATMEWGYGLFKASATDGCQFNTIKNCTVTLSIVNNATGTAPAFDGSRGVNMVNSLITTQTTAVTVTAATGSNSFNKFTSNTIKNVNIGFALSGFAATAGVGPTPNASTFFGDLNNEVGSNNFLEGNIIFNFGGATGATNPAAGIRTVNQWSQLIRYNSLQNNIGTGGGANHVSTLRGILVGNATSANAVISNNTITVVSGATTSQLDGISNSSGSTALTNTVEINNNTINIAYPTATTGIVNGIINSGTATTVNINTNTITNVSSLPVLQNTLGGTGTLVMIEGGSPVNVNINNNTVTTFARTGASGSWRGIKITSPTNSTISGNTIENLAYSTASSTGSIDGIYSLSSAVNVTITNNIVRNFSTPTTGTINGIREFGVAGNKTISGNQVYGFATTSGGAGGATFNGIFASNGTVSILNNTVYSLISSGTTGGTVGGVNGINIASSSAPWNIVGNKIYSLSTTSTSTTAGLVNGILASSGIGSITNNLISGLNTSATSGTDAVRGISLTSTTTGSLNVNYNTVYLNSVSSGTNFGTSGIFHTGSTTAGTATLVLQNNIIINESTPIGTGLNVAFRRATAASTNLSVASNRNLLFAGTPSATNLIYTDGTAQQTLAGYVSTVLPAGHDVNSITGEGFAYGTPGSYFISLTGASTDFLRPVAAIVTQTESGASNISGITTDYSSVIRAGNAGYSGTGTNPDMGAYEFQGTSPAPQITINSITPAGNQCTNVSRLVSTNITTTSGTIVSATLTYAINGTAQAPIAMTNTTGTTWEGTIPTVIPANAIVTWAVSSTNSLSLNSSTAIQTYSDEPLTGVTGTATASVTTVCAGNPSTLSASLTLSGSGPVGTAGANSTTFPDIPLNHLYGGSKTQYIYRASELTAAGFSAGNITSLSYNVTATGTTPLNGFSIAIGHTAQNVAVANTAITAGLTNVYSNAAQPVTLGANNFVFSTPFAWDGTSNIVVSFVYSNNNAGGTSATVTTSTASFLSTMGIRADNTTAACLFGATATTDACVNTTNSNSTSSVRPLLTFTGNRAPAITSVTWMNGATTVGTGNPFVVNPTVTATYSANITASGCVLTPAPTVTVNVNPVPTAPTATNSAQCGAAIPTASVASTSGMPTPTFNWYTVPSGGSPVQSSTSTTFTSTVSSTTTYYVSELNTVTGCEGARVAVTITVAAADGIDASASSASICIGSTVNLSVVNTNPTPFQTYTYTWQPLTNSGISAPTAGATQNNIMPTVPGTYKYAVSAVDGGCSAVDSVTVVVNPFTATVTPINATCFGSNNGSFSVASTTCGTAAQYAVDGGAFSATIPTNLTAGAHTVIVQNTLGYQTGTISFTVTEPAQVSAPVSATNATVCQDATTAQISASFTGATSVANFALSVQPTELSAGTVPATVAASPNIISSFTLPALPAGATITSATLTSLPITATGNSWQSDVRIGFTGAVNQNYSQGSTNNSAGTFNFNLSIPPAAINPAGGLVNLHYFDFFNDNSTGSEATFTTGANAFTLTIVYSVATAPTITWWTAPSSGTNLGTGIPFETVGTSVLPNTNTPGTYTFYAQGQNGTCISPTRLPVTVTVNANPTVNAGTDLAVCQGQQATLTATGTATSYVWSPVVTNGVAFTPAATGNYIVTGTGSNGCTKKDTVLVTVNALPIVSAGLDQTVCAGSSVTLNGSGAVSYTWNNGVTNATPFTATTTTTFTVTGTDANNCQNTDQVVVNVNNATSSSVSATACVTYTWAQNGMTYTTSGAYTDTVPNAVGCDSIITLNLVINQPTSSSVSETACSSFTWAQNGMTYTASGAYTDTIPNAAGCDSIITLNLVVNQPTSSSVSETACASYTWAQNGMTYTTSGAYTDTIPNAVGCDSIITLNLVINQPTSSSVSETACGSFTWSQNGTTYTVSGAYTDTIPNAVGCDSIITLNLTINNGGTSTETASACGTYTWAQNGQTYTASGAYDHVIVGGSANGCDSTITLNLTINAFPTATATYSGDSILTASAGTTYQWIDCATNTAIAGETAQTFQATANGSYAVVVTNAAGCSDTSACVTVNDLGLDGKEFTFINVYPNPTTSNVIVEMNVDNATIELVDAQGKVISVSTINNGGTIDLTNAERGVYFLRVRSENGETTKRIVKQ